MPTQRICRAGVPVYTGKLHRRPAGDQAGGRTCPHVKSESSNELLALPCHFSGVKAMLTLCTSPLLTVTSVR